MLLWDDLRYYLVAVRTGSYTSAGRRLGVNRTTVGRRIAAMESALGLPLFRETPHGPEPTPQGTRLLEAAARMEAEIDAMQADIAPHEARGGLVRISGSAGIVGEFIADFQAFLAATPGIAIEVLGELDPIDAVTQRRADLGMAIIKQPPRRLAGVQLTILKQAVYRLRGVTECSPLGWGHELDAALPGPGAPANPAGVEAEAMGLFTCNSWPQMKQAVLAGLGSAMLWCFAADDDPRLEQVVPPDPRDDMPLWLLHRGKAPPAPELARLIDFLAARLRDRLECG